MKRVSNLCELQNKKRILLLASNSEPLAQLKLDEELRDIEEAMKRAKNRHLYQIEKIVAARYEDLTNKLREYDPHILHFSGHGMKNGILLQGSESEKTMLPISVFVDVLKRRKIIECVIINACYSDALAKSINNKIGCCTIGMNDEIDDKAAIAFAKEFYAALGDEVDYDKAFIDAKGAFDTVMSNPQNSRGAKMPNSNNENYFSSPLVLFKKIKQEIADKNTSFKVAFSFSEDQRHYVKSVANHLRKIINKESIFYDKWHEYDLNSCQSTCELVIHFFSEKYKEINWNNKKWLSTSKILPIRMDDFVPEKMKWEKEEYIDGSIKTSKEISDIILDKLNIEINDEEGRGQFIFTGREKELKDILTGERSYHLILAPFKYGKTTLLNKIEDVYNDKGWVVKKSTSIQDSNVNNIVKELSHNAISDVESFYDYLRVKWVEKYKNNSAIGIVLLFDLSSIFIKESIDLMHKKFIEPLWRVLKEAGLTIDKFRVIITHTPLSQLKSSPYKIHYLSEFTYEGMVIPVEKYLAKNNSITIKNAKDSAAILFYKTGGYPLCVEAYMNNSRNAKKDESQDFFCLRGAIRNFCNSISPETAVLLKKGNLSIYRYVDRIILEKINRNLSVKDTSNLFSDLLTENGYTEYKFNSVYSKDILNDNLIRRIYAIKYRTKSPDKFIAACNDAAQIYLDFLGNKHKGEKLLTLWLVEYWYQLIQVRQVKHKDLKKLGFGKTRGLKDNEITTGIELLYENATNNYRQWCDFLQQQIKADWELKFLLCYNTYDQEYDDSKFEMFQDDIRNACESINKFDG